MSISSAFLLVALAALRIAELLLVISGSFNPVRRTDRSTELVKMNLIIVLSVLVTEYYFKLKHSSLL